MKHTTVTTGVLFLIFCGLCVLLSSLYRSLLLSAESQAIVALSDEDPAPITPTGSEYVNLVDTINDEKWTPETSPDKTRLVDVMNMRQDDRRLIEHIRKHWIRMPSSEPLDLVQPEKKHYSQKRLLQSATVDGILDERQGGFFVEFGAASGEELSNSLFFEKSRGWRGLLIEANPDSFKELFAKHRRAYTLNACVSPTTSSGKLKYYTAGLYGGLKDHMDENHAQYLQKKRRNLIENRRGFKLNYTEIEVPCFPLFSILEALNVSHVDYMSVDVEGPELEILQTIPFDRITFDVLTVEFLVIDCEVCSEKKKKAITDLMTATGQYKLHSVILWDLIFVRSNIARQSKI